MAVASCFLVINLTGSQINISANNQSTLAQQYQFSVEQAGSTILLGAFEPKNKVASLCTDHPQSITSGRTI